MGGNIKKVTATVPKVLNAAKQAGEAKKEKQRKTKKIEWLIGKQKAAVPCYVNKILGSVGKNIQNRMGNIKDGLQKEQDRYWRTVERGITQKGVAIYLLTDRKAGWAEAEMILRMRRVIMEQNPAYGWEKRLYEKIRAGIIEGGDNFGNSVYNKNIPVLSDLVGEIFHASERENGGDETNLPSMAGAFINGLLGTGLLGTVDDIGSVITDPLGTAEGIVGIGAHQEESFPALFEAAKKAVDKNLIHGSGEDRCRVAGAVVFEIVSALFTSGKVAAATRAGDKAADTGMAARASRMIQNTKGMIKGGITKGAKRIVSSKRLEQIAGKADDILGELARIMSGPGSEPALVTGALDDGGGNDYLKKYLEDLRKSLDIVEESGVKIHKAEGLGDELTGGGDKLGIRVNNEKIRNNFTDSAIDHANIGEFTYNPKTNEISKMRGGGHGQKNLELLDSLGIEYNIEKTYSNGVRIGNIPDHKQKLKRTGTGQSWFPKEWDDKKIQEAGNYVIQANKGMEIDDGKAIFAEYDGVKVGVIYTNGEPATIFPDVVQPE